jgi:hypothetical protein
VNGCQEPVLNIKKIVPTRAEISSSHACPDRPAPGTSTVTKDQSININIGSLESEKASSSQAITLSEAQKYTVKIDSDTDWPAVTATLLVGVAIAWFAFNTQRSQIRSSVANFRHDWQNNLRTKIAEFLAKAILIESKMQADPEYLNKDISDEPYSELILIQSTIELMLDTKKQYTKTLTRAMEEIIQGLKDSSPEINEHIHSLSTTASQVLEQAWQDIRKDLGLKRKRDKA